MSPFPDTPLPDASRRSPFVTTNWSAVRRAGDEMDPGNTAALEALCKSYWQPVYAYVRRRGCKPEDARDLTQGFFADLLARAAIAKADSNSGRFRTFLLASLNNFLSKSTERASALKRGAGVPALSLDWDAGEEFFQLESGERFVPENLFDRRWAHQLTQVALARLREEVDSPKSTDRFETLSRYLLAEPAPGAYEQHAAELGLSISGIKTLVRRLRLRFGAILKEEVARTVNSPDDVEDELRHLLGMLSLT